MDRAIRLLRDEKDALQKKIAVNAEEIRRRQDENTCLNATTKELLSGLTAVPKFR